MGVGGDGRETNNGSSKEATGRNVNEYSSEFTYGRIAQCECRQAHDLLHSRGVHSFPEAAAISCTKVDRQCAEPLLLAASGVRSRDLDTREDGHLPLRLLHDRVLLDT